MQSAFHATVSYLTKRAELLGVSLWMLLATAAQTLNYEIERLVVGRIGSL